MARILIIVDEQEVRDGLRTMLERAGHGVIEALNGREGVDLYGQIPADLVILDLHIPEMDGLEVTTKLRAEYPDARIITITALRQRHDYDFSRAAAAMGADRTLEKPFSTDEMLKAVEELLMSG